MGFFVLMLPSEQTSAGSFGGRDIGKPEEAIGALVERS
jgi:hypothetical protein